MTGEGRGACSCEACTRNTHTTPPMPLQHTHEQLAATQGAKEGDLTDGRPHQPDLTLASSLATLWCTRASARTGTGPNPSVFARCTRRLHDARLCG